MYGQTTRFLPFVEPPWLQQKLLPGRAGRRQRRRFLSRKNLQDPSGWQASCAALSSSNFSSAVGIKNVKSFFASARLHVQRTSFCRLHCTACKHTFRRSAAPGHSEAAFVSEMSLALYSVWSQDAPSLLQHVARRAIAVDRLLFRAPLATPHSCYSCTALCTVVPLNGHCACCEVPGMLPTIDSAAMQSSCAYYA